MNPTKGLCLCGCGETTAIAKKTSRRAGEVRGQSRRFVKGHNGKKGTLAERFMAQTIPEPNSGCLLWTGSSNEKGYGQINIDGRSKIAHRVAWLLKHGPIPDGVCVLHRCDTPACVNAESHLFLGTKAENNEDAVRKGRINYASMAKQPRAEFCHRGHPFDAANTRITNGKRFCRTCHRERARKYAQKKRRDVDAPRAELTIRPIAA